MFVEMSWLAEEGGREVGAIEGGVPAGSSCNMQKTL
jgi:hypothetical protein